MRTILFTTFAALAFLAAVPSTALAQAGDIDARIDDAKEAIKADKKAIKDDKKDLKAIAKLRKKWEKAREKGKAKLEDKVDPLIMEWVREELAESARETREARGELAASGADMDGHAAHAVPGPKPTASGRGRTEGHSANHGDTAAQRDDRGDMRAARQDLRRTREIAEDLRELQSSFRRDNAGPKKYERKAKLLRQLERGAERDLARSEAEREEDEAQLDRLKARKKAQ